MLNIITSSDNESTYSCFPLKIYILKYTMNNSYTAAEFLLRQIEFVLTAP